MKNLPMLVAALAAALPVFAAPWVDVIQPEAKPPAARVLEVGESQHGREVVDRYRWLEDVAAEAGAFYREQSSYTRRELDRIEGRKALLDRIRSLSEFNTAITALGIEGNRLFYLKSAPGLVRPVLCTRDGFSGAERVLFDPVTLGADAAIDWFVASPDGRHVAYGTSRGGNEASVLRVMEVSSGKDLGIAIDRARFNASLAWHPDGRSFFYARLPEAQGRNLANVRLYRHVLGRDSAKDEIVFAPGVGGARDVPAQARPSVLIPAEGRRAYVVVREGVRRELTVHDTDLRDLAAGKPRWTRIVEPADGVIAVEGWRDDLFLLTHKNAPRRQILLMRTGGKTRLVVPEGDAVIQSMGLARDALYLRGMHAGLDRLERVPIGLLGAKKPEFVKTPFDTHIAQLVTDPRRHGAILRLAGWIEPPAIVEVDARTGDLKDTKLQPAPVSSFAEMDEVRLYAPAQDGTKIPVTLVYRKSTMLTGDNPLILMAYGSYGVTMAPVFDPARLAWLERGGIIAIAHVRGGGEYGEPWHEAGRGAAKETTITDLIACAEFVTKYGFTSARRLAIQGTSAGGIPVGGAFVRRPELFAAMVGRVPLMDMLRFETSANGPPNAPEFGTTATKAGFEALEKISAYHRVADGVAYPAVLLTAGMNDPRVDPWQAGKMAARVQAASTSGRPVLLRVDFDSGHGYGTSRRAREDELADIYTFLFWQFGHPGFQPPAPPPPPPPPPPQPPPPPPPKPVEPPPPSLSPG